MPCYLLGRIVISDYERLKARGTNLGLTIIKQGELILVTTTDGSILFKGTEKDLLSQPSSILNTLLRDYNIQKVKLSAQKAGWKTRIQHEDNKIKITLTE